MINLSGKFDEYKTSYVMSQIIKHLENMSYDELVRELARLRALEIKAESPHNTWF